MLGFYQGIKQLPVKIRLFASSLGLYNPFAMFPPSQLPRLGGYLRDFKTQPKFVLYILIDEPCKKILPGFGSTQFGGKCAAPVFASVAKRSLEYLGVAHDDPYGFSAHDVRSDVKRGDMTQEIEQLEVLYKKYNAPIS